MNKYGLLGILSFPGLIGIFYNKTEFLGFFVFVLFIPFLFIKADESFELSIRKACTRAFITNITTTSIAAIIFVALGMVDIALLSGCVIGFSISIVIFFITVFYFEWQEKTNLDV